MNTRKNIHPSSAIVAMSGGVDSSVAAMLLKEKGWNVCGITCKMFGSNVVEGDRKASDDWLESADDAKRVCQTLGIDHYTFNCKDVFEHKVILPFVDSYINGRTPNPCVNCNKFVKFGTLHKHRAELGYEFLSTGHYAQIKQDEASGRWLLLKAEHIEKDQSYMLCHMTQEELAHTIFPLGSLAKKNVRELARKIGLANADREESQDICFIQDKNYVAFIERWLKNHPAESGKSRDSHSNEDNPGQPEEVSSEKAGFERMVPELRSIGPIVNASGVQLGEHQGLINYTIGQRKGIGIASAEPLYVVDKDTASNTLVVGKHDELMTQECQATNVNFISMPSTNAIGRHLKVEAKTAYRQRSISAMAHFDGENLHVTFDVPIVKPAPGQTLVLYDHETGQSVVAGATII